MLKKLQIKLLFHSGPASPVENINMCSLVFGAIGMISGSGKHFFMVIDLEMSHVM